MYDSSKGGSFHMDLKPTEPGLRLKSQQASKGLEHVPVAGGLQSRQLCENEDQRVPVAQIPLNKQPGKETVNQGQLALGLEISPL